MPLSSLFSSQERTRLRHAVFVVAACSVFSVVASLVLDGDLQLRKANFLPEALRFMLAMSLAYGSIIAFAVAVWVTFYNGAFFFSRIRKARGRNLCEKRLKE